MTDFELYTRVAWLNRDTKEYKLTNLDSRAK